MSCPSSDELSQLLAPGEPRDPARATAILAHVRECPRCREALRSDIETKLPPIAGMPSPRKRKGPSNVLIGLLGLALGLFVFSRVGFRHAKLSLDGDIAAPVSSSSR